MIARPAGWLAVPGVRTQTLVAPEGPDAAGIRYTERARPLRRMRDIIADWQRRKAKVTDMVVGPIERLVTVEGEHAAFVTIDGAFDARRVQASLGVVFGDDFFALLEGFALRAELFSAIAAKVRELTIADRHMLGHRRRRYEHASPEGWQAIVRGYTTDWIAPGYPLRSGMMVTYAATPVEPSDEVVVAALVARAIERGFGPERAATTKEIETTTGLAGVISEAIVSGHGGRVLRSFVTLTEGRYLYSCELLARTEAEWPAHQDAFARLWRSIVPIPRPPPTAVTSASAGLFEFWAD
ncbi:MAG: hypothetical protein AB7T06_25740 [Kofleriaceae bacterium]